MPMTLNQRNYNLCHKIKFSNPYIFATHLSRALLFQTMKSVRSNNLILMYDRFTQPHCPDLGRTNLILWQTQFSFP